MTTEDAVPTITTFYAAGTDVPSHFFEGKALARLRIKWGRDVIVEETEDRRDVYWANDNGEYTIVGTPINGVADGNLRATKHTHFHHRKRDI